MDFDDNDDPAEGFQVFINPHEGVNAALGHESDGTYGEKDGYSHLGLVRVHGEADDGGPGPWLAFHPHQVRELRQIPIPKVAHLLGLNYTPGRSWENDKLDEEAGPAALEKLWQHAEPVSPSFYDPREPLRRCEGGLSPGGEALTDIRASAQLLLALRDLRAR